jgi:hypothetical protein
LHIYKDYIVFVFRRFGIYVAGVEKGLMIAQIQWAD